MQQPSGSGLANGNLYIDFNVILLSHVSITANAGTRYSAKGTKGR